MLERTLKRFMKIPFLNTRSIIVLVLVAGVLVAISTGITGKPTKVNAASISVPLNMCCYGWMDYTTEQSIINARPEFLVGSSTAGPWRGNANISKLQAAGIKYFEYIDVAYVGHSTYPRAIPTDLWSNLSYIEAAAQAGAYGIFVDEVCDGIYTTPDYYYLGQIADKAHSLGLKVVFNVSMPNWSDALMDYCDYINSSETWQGEALSSSQSKWASRTWLLTYNVYDSATAAALTDSALRQGIRAHYACTSYIALPGWLDTYATQVSYTYTVTSFEDILDPANTEQAMVTFNSNPTGVEVWLDYSYKGVTPLTTYVAEGNHHIAFAQDDYSTLEGDFAADNTSFTVTGDLLGGKFTSSGTEKVSSAQAPVSLPDDFLSLEVLLDRLHNIVEPAVSQVLSPTLKVFTKMLNP